MASVSDVGEGSHDHDRDDHGATEEGNVRMTVHERWAQESADPIDSNQIVGQMWFTKSALTQLLMPVSTSAT